MFGLGASHHFPGSESWWRDPPALDTRDSPWDAAEISAWQKHVEEDSALTPLAGANKEVLQAEDLELEAIKAKVREMEKDDEWLQELQNEAKSLLVRSDAGFSPCRERPILRKSNGIPCVGRMGGQRASSRDSDAVMQNCRRRAKGLLLSRINEKKVEADQRSIYVGNVDYGGTAEELESYFNGCGQINRVTILCDKFSGHPKGYAYIEFADQSALKAAMELDEGTFRGRIIKVLPKRTNFPGISSTDRGGSRGRFRGRGALPRHASFCGGQRSRPRGRVFRGRGRIPAWYTPY